MKRLHFVGIGGARLRGLAKLYQDRGYKISGSDWKNSKEIADLVARGITVHIGHQAENVRGADLVVYTNAVGSVNPEVQEAQRLGIPILEGAELLGKLMADVGTGIAIAGTHGKTTTTAMTTMVLTEGGLDPTAFIGGEVSTFGGNHRTGSSPFMVVEACEFKRSFLKLKPKVELITNIDWDHPDCYPNLDEVIKVFGDFVDLLPDDGLLTVWGDDPNALALQQRFSGKVVTFGYREEFDWSLSELRSVAPLGIGAKLCYRGKPQGELVLKVPGKHNLQNALGSLALATELGVNLPSALKTLGEFNGVKKRFEIKGNYRGTIVIDDYAHHPSAIRMALDAARRCFSGRIWCAFQPHLYSRTKYLLAEFAEAFKDADVVVLADIYAAREQDSHEISSRDLAEQIRRHHPDVRYLGGFDAIYDHLRDNLQSGDLLITMGAGDIWKVGERLVQSAEGI